MHMDLDASGGPAPAGRGPAVSVARPWRETGARIGLPLALGVLLFILVILPVGFMFVGSVHSGNFADPKAYFTLAVLEEVYGTWPYLRITAATIAISAIVAGLATVAGTVLGWLLSRTDIPAKGFLESAIIAPLYLSPFVGALAWLILASPNSGILNVMARGLLGPTAPPLINVMTPVGVVLVMTLYFIPYAYLTVSASLRNIDPSMEEASYLNGAGVLATAAKVTFPVIRPSLISAFFFVFVLTAGTFSIPAALGGADKIPFLAVAIYRLSASYPIDYTRAAALGTLLFWISLVGIVLYQFAARVATRFVTVTARGYRIRLVPLRHLRGVAVGIVVAYLVLAIVLPYLALTYSAFTRYATPSVFSAPYTLQNFIRVFNSVEIRNAIENTFIVGVLSPTFTVVLALVLTYAVRRMRVAGRRLLEYAAMFPIAVPGIVFGTGIFWTYITTPVYGTIWLLVLAFVASYIPFAYRIADTALLQIDKALEEASSLCGASHWRTATRITFNLVRPALLSSWVLVFIFSVREISAAILLSSPTNKVLSVLSWDYLEFGNVSNAAIVGLIQTAILVLGVAAGRWLFRVRLTQGV
jgi:iron(III) transport system permease protein